MNFKKIALMSLLCVPVVSTMNSQMNFADDINTNVETPRVTIPEEVKESMYISDGKYRSKLCVRQSDINESILSDIFASLTITYKKDGEKLTYVYENPSQAFLDKAVQFDKPLSTTIGIQKIKLIIDKEHGMLEPIEVQVNVVPDNAVISEDLFMAMMVGNANPTISVEQAKSMRDLQSFVDLNQVTSIDADGVQRKMWLDKDQEGVKQVQAGNVGTFDIKYFVTTKEITTRDGDGYYVDAKITVQNDESQEPGIDQPTSGNEDGTQGSISTPNKNETTTNHTPNKGVATGTIGIMPIITVAGIAAILLVSKKFIK